MSQPFYARGSDLPADVQRQALAAFVHRYTKDHRPAWATTADATAFPGGVYPVQFASDADWLANTVFAVTRGRQLDGRVRHCESSPTWPDNPELRRQAVPA